MQAPLVVALAGPDRWLRPKLINRLTEAGIGVRDLGLGTASLRDVDVLVYLPLLMPTTNPEKDAGVSQSRITFAAATEGRIGRAIVLSRVGPDRHDPYLDALRAVEAGAAQLFTKLTVVRTAHPIGDPADAGPVVDSLRQRRPDAMEGADPAVEPVALEDLVDVLQAAVEGKIGAGFVELGGPKKIALSSLQDLVASAGNGTGDSDGIGEVRPRHRRRPLMPSRRKAEAAAERLLTLESVANRKFASPLGAPARDVHHAWARA